jgi:hypothetical protein
VSPNAVVSKASRGSSAIGRHHETPEKQNEPRSEFAPVSRFCTRAVGAAVVLLLLVACRSESPAPGGPNGTGPNGTEFSEFTRRVDAYMKLHDELERGAGAERTTSDSADLEARRDALRAVLQERRAGAKQGDIFTPEVATAFRRALNPELRGNEAAQARAAIREDGPREFTLKPNAPYPDDAAFGTIPPNVLAALPSLPEHLEYRIVRNDLLLRDVHANIVVDYMYDVMCTTC